MKLNYKRTMFVGMAFFLICMFWQAYDSLVPKILTDKFGLSQSFSGVVMALDNVLALFLLPFFGALSDRCNSKHGRRTPFIVVGTICAAVLFFVLSLADNMQRSDISDVSIDNAAALERLYEADLTIKTPDGESINIKEAFEKDEFLGISMYEADGVTVTGAYTDYVVPARQAYAWNVTTHNPSNLIFFMVLLLLVLISMSAFRSPAVALMPDVTIRPLRSKANAIINLMGTIGGIVVLILGIVLKTGKTENALMSYVPFFSVISFLMLVCLSLFLWQVNEPKLVDIMKEDSIKYGIEDKSENVSNGNALLDKEQKTSLCFILASVVLWYMGYNAVISKYSVYAGKVLNVDYNATLMIAQAAAVVSYLPIGAISSRIGRKKTILLGVAMLAFSFGTAAFLRSSNPVFIMNVLFSIAGIGWAAISVNSFPMVVELAKDGDVGKYTGIYYTASMAAQTVTPILSGILMDIKFTTLFPYATVFVCLSFATMLFVKHGDSVPDKRAGFLEQFDVDD